MSEGDEVEVQTASLVNNNRTSLEDSSEENGEASSLASAQDPSAHDPGGTVANKDSANKDRAQESPGLAIVLEKYAADLKEQKDLVAEYKDKYMRTLAEMDNLRKRLTKEKMEALRYAGEDLARDMLEVLDLLTLALNADEKQKEDRQKDESHKQESDQSRGGDSELVKGIKLTLERFISILGQHLVVGEIALGKPFDPNKHEAVASEVNAEVAPNTVVSEFRR